MTIGYVSARFSTVTLNHENLAYHCAIFLSVEKVSKFSIQHNDAGISVRVERTGENLTVLIFLIEEGPESASAVTSFGKNSSC